MYQANSRNRLKGPGLRIPGTARQLGAGSRSANTALTVGCQRISILAVTADIRYSLGTATQTANANTSHLIKTGERLELDVPQNIDSTVDGNGNPSGANYGQVIASNIAVIRDASSDGTLELTEFIN